MGLFAFLQRWSATAVGDISADDDNVTTVGSNVINDRDSSVTENFSASPRPHDLDNLQSSEISELVKVDKSLASSLEFSKYVTRLLNRSSKPVVATKKNASLGMNASLVSGVRAGDDDDDNIIIHIRQRTDWDCGIACLQMVLAWINRNETKNEAINSDDNSCFNSNEMGSDYWKHMCELIATESVWTVDLVAVLFSMIIQQQSGSGGACNTPCTAASVLFCSQSLHVNNDLQGLAYYKSAFQKDCQRVQQRVEQLLEWTTSTCTPPSPSGGKIDNNNNSRPAPRLFLHESKILSLSDVLNVVAEPNVIAIVLVDQCVWRQQQPQQSSSKSYVGHYVLLTAIIPKTNSNTNSAPVISPGKDTTRFEGVSLVVYNPATADGPIHCDPLLFERAWCAPGTDQDVIFVARHPPS